MGRLLIALGVLLILVGLLWPVLSRIGFGRLPGDILIERENVRVWIPITSAILASVVLTLVLNLVVWWLNR